MSSRGRSVVTTGLTTILLAASSGVSSGGGYGLFLCLVGLLTGVDLMAVGIWMAVGIEMKLAEPHEWEPNTQVSTRRDRT